MNSVIKIHDTKTKEPERSGGMNGMIRVYDTEIRELKRIEYPSSRIYRVVKNERSAESESSTPTEREIHELGLSDEFERQSQLRFHEGSIVARSIGELTRTDRIERGGDQMPEGCQWARRCEDCPWSDCIIEEPQRLAYNSKTAQRDRAHLMIYLHGVKGWSLKRIAAFFGVGRQAVWKGMHALGYRTHEMNKALNAEMVRMLHAEMSTREAAGYFGVSRRTVQRAQAASRGGEPE